jgi:uncharacterized membrane protein
LAPLARIPGLGWYALAGALFLLGIGVAAALVWRFVATFEEPARFLAPGAAQVTIARPGDYVIWHEYRTVYEGRSFDIPAAMPHGARYVVQAPDGGSIAVQPYGGMSTEGAGGRSVSVARFEAELPGPHRVAVEGAFEPRVIAVGPHRLWPLLKLIAAVCAALAIGLGLAVVAGLYGFLGAVQAPASGAANAEGERSLRQLLALVYGLQAVSLLVGLTAIAGVIIDYLRREQAQGTWLESHFSWQIRTFWWSLVWCIIGIATAILLVGFLILAAAAVWYVYRIAKGWTYLNESKPMYG